MNIWAVEAGALTLTVAASLTGRRHRHHAWRDVTTPSVSDQWLSGQNSRQDESQ